MLLQSPGAAVAEGRAPRFDDYSIGVVLFGAQTLLNTASFMFVVMAARRWRVYPVRTVLLVSAISGVFAQLMAITGIAMIAVAPLITVFGRNAVWLAWALPGALAAVVALFWVRAKPQAGGRAD